MKSYRVTMINPLGKQVVEVIPAESTDRLLSLIKERGNYCVDYAEVAHIDTIKRRKLPLQALVVFCYQVSAMLSAGVSLIDTLKMIQGKANSVFEKRIYRNLYEEVQKGNALSIAMIQQDGAFDDLLINMVQAGESSGSLHEVLTTMSVQYERDKKVRNRLRTASIYPLMLFIVSVAVVLILVTFVLPGITASFPMDQMPFMTRIMIGFSDFVIHRWYVLVLFLLILVAVIYVALSNRETRIAVHRQLLYFPIVGKLMRTIYSARCARSFASLYRHGVPALEMIQLTGNVLGNTYLEDQFEQMYVKVSRGDLISTAISAIDEFDAMLPSMIRVGEEVGDLENILIKTADYFDGESETAVTQLIGFVEPLMIVVLGVIIAMIVLSIMQPIFKMYEYIQ